MAHRRSSRAVEGVRLEVGERAHDAVGVEVRVRGQHAERAHAGAAAGFEAGRRVLDHDAARRRDAERARRR